MRQPVSDSPRKSQRDDEDDSAESGPYITTVLKSEGDSDEVDSNHGAVTVAKPLRGRASLRILLLATV